MARRAALHKTAGPAGVEKKEEKKKPPFDTGGYQCALLLTATYSDLLRADPEFVIESLEEKLFQCFLRQIVDRNTAQAAKHVEGLVSSNDEIAKRGGGGVGRVHASANGLC